jgi:thioredoxin-dependent peroxiredoxin
MERNVKVMRTSRLSLLVAAGLIVFAPGAQAALKAGDSAPDFTLKAAVGGKDLTFSLAERLKKGLVVLYFYPKSFTKGCTIEAHEFAEHAEDFANAGASLLGVSSDTLEIQREFSTKECRDKFPVGADPDLSVIKAYDALRDRPGPSGATLADRISYVIADGKIVFALSDANPVAHVQSTLDFIRRWRNEHER